MRQAVPIGQTALQVSTSIGVVVQRTGSVTPQELMARADQALYQAKRGGRDRYAEYEI
jgi:diguanylate cyclase (GGDEF)-like protein